MRLLLIGAPGAGKGTQAERIAERFGITHISSGDLLRQHMADGTRIGRAVQEYVRRGDLVPDGIIMDMLCKPVVAASASGGYVLDGFPRTVAQAQAAYRVAGDLGAAVQAAVYLEVPAGGTGPAAAGPGPRRGRHRRGHRAPDPGVPGQDGADAGVLREAGMDVRVDGAQPPDAVHQEIVARLHKLSAFASEAG